MTRSTYISENLTRQQIDFMLSLDDYDPDIFTLDELKQQFSQHFNYINELAENLVHKKMAFKGHIFTGIEQLINPENDKQLSASWKNSLAYQITGELPDYENVNPTCIS